MTELTINISNTLMENQFTPNNSTFSELVSSGNLNLISNDIIKISLLDLEGLYKKNQFFIDHETFDYREYISKPAFKHRKILIFFYGQKTVEQQGIVISDFENLFQNFEYKNGLVISNITMQSMITLLETIDIKSKK